MVLSRGRWHRPRSVTASATKHGAMFYSIARILAGPGGGSVNVPIIWRRKTKAEWVRDQRSHSVEALGRLRRLTMNTEIKMAAWVGEQQPK